MMLKQLRWLCASSFLMVGVGCQTLGFTSSMASDVGEDPNANEKLQLPPKEGAKACVAAAEVLEKGEKYTEAVALYERARATDSAYAYVGRRLAVLYDRTGNFPKADEEYTKALKASPKDADLLNDYAYSHYLRGNWEATEEHCRKALDVQPEHKRAWMNLGLALAQLGRTEESFEAFTKVVPPAQAHCNIGFALAARGQTTDAIIAYRQAIRLAPELQIAHAAIAKLDATRAKPAIEQLPAPKPTRLPTPVTTNDDDWEVPASKPLPDAILRPDMPKPPASEPPLKPRDVPTLDQPEPRVPVAPLLEDVPVPPPLPPAKRFVQPPNE